MIVQSFSDLCLAEKNTLIPLLCVGHDNLQHIENAVKILNNIYIVQIIDIKLIHKSLKTLILINSLLLCC